MPYRPNTPCRHPGCAALVPYGQKYCEKHKALHPEEVRSAAKRGYGRKWQKASREYLQAHPLCVLCMKKQPPRYVKGRQWLTTLPHTVATKSCSGTGATSRHCVNSVMIKRRGRKITIQLIDIDLEDIKGDVLFYLEV
jgi:hypothetical protein